VSSFHRLPRCRLRLKRTAPAARAHAAVFVVRVAVELACASKVSRGSAAPLLDFPRAAGAFEQFIHIALEEPRGELVAQACLDPATAGTAALAVAPAAPAAEFVIQGNRAIACVDSPSDADRARSALVVARISGSRTVVVHRPHGISGPELKLVGDRGDVDGVGADGCPQCAAQAPAAFQRKRAEEREETSAKDIESAIVAVVASAAGNFDDEEVCRAGAIVEEEVDEDLLVDLVHDREMPDDAVIGTRVDDRFGGSSICGDDSHALHVHPAEGEDGCLFCHVLGWIEVSPFGVLVSPVSRAYVVGPLRVG